MCCFSDLSQTYFRGITKKGKTGKEFNENAKRFPDFPQPFLMINVQEDPRNNKTTESGLNIRQPLPYACIYILWYYVMKHLDIRNNQ